MPKFKHVVNVSEGVMSSQLQQIFKIPPNSISVLDVLRQIDDSGRCALPLRRARFIQERIPIRQQILDARPRDRLFELCEETPETVMVIPDSVLPGNSSLHFVIGTEYTSLVSRWWSLCQDNPGAQIVAATFRGVTLIAIPVQACMK